MKKILASILIGTMILSSSIVAQAATPPYNISTVSGRSFSVENSQLEPYETSEIVKAENFNLVTNGTSADLTLELDSNTLDFHLELLPSQFGLYKGNTIIGVSSEYISNYNIVNFRIEKSANQIALMQENLSLANTTVLFLGLNNSLTNEVSYFQIELDGFDFDSIYEVVNRQFDTSSYTSEDVESIEVSYLTMAPAKKARNSTATTFTETGTLAESDGNVENTTENGSLSDALESLKQTSDNGFINVNARASSLINGIPDAVYKSGDFDVWQHGWNGWDVKTGYMVYPMRYAGTDNRLHYVMTFSIPQNINWDTQTFDIGFRVTNNCWVLYNAYTGDLGIFDSSARVAADVDVHYTSNSYRGVFTRRYYTLNKNGSNAKNIAKVVIGYIPYLSDIANIYETLTSSDATTTNKTYPFGDNIEAQISEGKIIREVEVSAEGLKQISDYLYMELV